MIIQCRTCANYFDDAYRTTICPHETFAANDGHNNFAHHPTSYLSADEPRRPRQLPPAAPFDPWPAGGPAFPAQFPPGPSSSPAASSADIAGKDERPTENQIRGLIIRIEWWRLSDVARDAGPAHFHFNEGVRAALAWVLGEDIEPIMRLGEIEADRRQPRNPVS